MWDQFVGVCCYYFPFNWVNFLFDWAQLINRLISQGERKMLSIMIIIVISSLENAQSRRTQHKWNFYNQLGESN